MGDALATPGNCGALLLRTDGDGSANFELTTLWESWEAIRAFAGDDVRRAVLYAEDAAFFDGWDEEVKHALVIEAAAPDA